jgi:long-subunit acyl-CoA synthetase (AMP-forming)
MPGTQARLIGLDGQDIDSHNCPGELVIRGPSVVPGYFDNDAAMAEMLTDDGWLRSGDLVEMRKSSNGHTHLFVIDRIKELIKVHVSLASALHAGYLLRPSYQRERKLLLPSWRLS